MRTTINISDHIIKETETIYKANSRSKSIEMALQDALQQKKIEQLKEMIGKIEFDEKAILELREKER